MVNAFASGARPEVLSHLWQGKVSVSKHAFCSVICRDDTK